MAGGSGEGKRDRRTTVGWEKKRKIRSYQAELRDPENNITALSGASYVDLRFHLLRNGPKNEPWIVDRGLVGKYVPLTAVPG